MSAVETARSPGRSFLSIDISWPNVVFSLRTAAAAILALALAYWLELSDPQWATLTVFILAQPTVGAALAKGVWRAVGTVAGGVAGLVLVALFSQAAELLVAVTVLLVGASFYAGARLRNYTSYGVLLGGYTMLLIAYEGSSAPLQAWSIAVDRTTEILIGIACATLASVIVLPRYAGDVLR
ncbi:MAG TPA: FUSC family protein, partial [Rhizomicrobium sp.]